MAAGNNADESHESEPKQESWGPENQNSELEDTKMLCRKEGECRVG